jgi:CheY-like chemotaxis protein
VLLVVRNATLLRILSRQLQRWGFNVVSVPTSTEALALARTGWAFLVADVNHRPDDNLLIDAFALPTVVLRQGGEEERLKQIDAEEEDDDHQQACSGWRTLRRDLSRTESVSRRYCARVSDVLTICSLR